MPTQNRRCTECGSVYELLIMGRRIIPMTDGIDDYPGCPGCGAMSHTVVIEAPAIVGTAVTYPYYDRGLGQWLKSKQHRADVAKSMGLVPVEGDWPDGPSEHHQKMLAQKAAYEADQKLYEEHPDFREWRELRDKGVLEDEKRAAVEEAKRAHEPVAQRAEQLLEEADAAMHDQDQGRLNEVRAKVADELEA